MFFFFADRRTDLTKPMVDFRNFPSEPNMQIANFLTAVSPSCSQYPAVGHCPELDQSIQFFISLL
jgi:hypothetical protein